VDTKPELDAPKTSARDQWERAAAGWDHHAPVIRQWLRTATDTMLNMAGVAPGVSVLDMAAGAGDQTLDIARRVGPEGSVLATDFSPAILALAQQRAEDAGFRNVGTLVADGEHLPDSLGPFDAAVCRLGLMLFADPLQGLREMHRVLRPGGGICTVVFSRPEKNPCVAILMQVALQHAGLAPRQPFQPGGLLSLGQPGFIDGLFEQAGFREVATTAMEAPFALPSARHYLDFVRASASPIQQILSRLDGAAQEAAWSEMEARLRAFDTADGWVGPNELLLTAARR
jgi:ubiquinone/menaquinone biosynthesis C-methylase UbiE